MLKRQSLLIVGLLSVALLSGACSKPSHQERTAKARTRYVAELSSFLVQQEPIESVAEPLETVADDSQGAVDETVVGDGGEEPSETSVELIQNVLLDIVIRHDSFDKLPGLTVDITMADGDREVQSWRVWFDTAGIDKGPGVQYSHTLENVDYQPGFGFSAEVRFPVPAEERSEYREFSIPEDGPKDE